MSPHPHQTWSYPNTRATLMVPGTASMVFRKGTAWSSVSYYFFEQNKICSSTGGGNSHIRPRSVGCDIKTIARAMLFICSANIAHTTIHALFAGGQMRKQNTSWYACGVESHLQVRMGVQRGVNGNLIEDRRRVSFHRSTFGAVW